MTFSQRVKDELLNINDEQFYKVELIAILKCLGTIECSNNSAKITINITQLKLVKHLLLILKKLYPDTKHDSMISTKRNFSTKRKTYRIVIYDDVMTILTDLGLVNDPNRSIILLNPVNIDQLDESEQRVYVRMCFCCAGSVNTPQKEQQYHLEMVVNDKNQQQLLIDIAKQYNINLKVTTRKYSQSLYLNKSEEIGDFLNLIGCKETLFDFEDERILRDLYLNANRVNNAEIANESKSINASQKQIEAINIIKQNNLFDDLGKKTKKVANLRLGNPDVTLNQLAELSGGEFSKSNVSYHLKSIVKLAQTIDNQEE